nr:putative reverse transcriptase domain-containing protein [Tanacetum cinerariifolium]
MQREKVIAYASRQLKVHEQNYTTHDLELGSVVFALKMYMHYQYGTKYTVFIDHKSLQQILEAQIEALKPENLEKEDVGTSAAGGPAVGIDPLPVGTSTAPLAKTVVASMDVSTVAISYVSSLALSAAASPSSKFLPFIGASSPDPSAAPPSLSSNSLTLAFNLVTSISRASNLTASSEYFLYRLVYKAINSLIVCCILPSTASGEVTLGAESWGNVEDIAMVALS